MTEQQLDTSLHILDRLSENQIIVTLAFLVVSLVFSIYFAVTVWRVIHKKDYYTATFMDFAEDKLDGIEKNSVRIFLGLWPKYAKHEMCESCIHPRGSFQGTLHISLISTLQRIKIARHKNGFHKLNPVDYEIYLTNLATRLRNKNQTELCNNSIGLGNVIEETHDDRFTETDSIAVLREIMDEAKRLYKLEKRDIMKIIFLVYKDDK